MMEMQEEQKHRLQHGCSRCPKRWSGSKTAHCPSCHETFSGPSAFDLHRDNGKCTAPRGMKNRGLAVQERAGYSVWGYAQADDRWDEKEEDE
jgi:hypothetical protein